MDWRAQGFRGGREGIHARALLLSRYVPQQGEAGIRREGGRPGGDHKKVDNIALPAWAKGSPFVFVTEQRRALESVELEQMGQQLGRWIDLVFGCLQRSKEAEKVWNVFQPL